MAEYDSFEDYLRDFLRNLEVNPATNLQLAAGRLLSPYVAGALSPVTEIMGRAAQAPGLLGIAEEAFPGAGEFLFEEVGAPLRGASDILGRYAVEKLRAREETGRRIAGLPSPEAPKAIVGSSLAFPGLTEGENVTVVPQPIRAIRTPDGRIVFTNWERPGKEIPYESATEAINRPEQPGGGPFRTRGTPGGFIPSAPIPSELGTAEEFKARLGAESPLVQDIMRQRRAEYEATAQAELLRQIQRTQLPGGELELGRIMREQATQETAPKVEAAVARFQAQNPKATPEQVAAARMEAQGLLTKQWIEEQLRIITAKERARAGAL